jgi:hypothetical protein
VRVRDKVNQGSAGYKLGRERTTGHILELPTARHALPSKRATTARIRQQRGGNGGKRGCVKRATRWTQSQGQPVPGLETNKEQNGYKLGREGTTGHILE